MTLEITEGQVIENLNLYREAMHSFLDLGFTFAIDDVGAGYSGLETIANLGANYLKIDMGLVRNIHEKKVSQQVVKAILEMGTRGGRGRDRARGSRRRRRRRPSRSLGAPLRPGLLLRAAAGSRTRRPRRRAAEPIVPTTADDLAERAMC